MLDARPRVVPDARRALIAAGTGRLARTCPCCDRAAVMVLGERRLVGECGECGARWPASTIVTARTAA